MNDADVSAVMTHDAAIVPPETTVRDASTHLDDADTPALVVCSASGSTLGVVTGSDLARANDDRPVETVMSPAVAPLDPSTPARLAVYRLCKSGAPLVPVAEDGVLAGVVTREALTDGVSWRQSGPTPAGGSPPSDARRDVPADD